MRKFILLFLVLIVAASVTANTAVKAQDAPQQQEVVQNVNDDSTRTLINTDSIRAKGIRLGQKIAEGAMVAADSISAFGARMSEKAQPLADTIVERSRRAWRVLTGEEEKPEHLKQQKK